MYVLSSGELTSSRKLYLQDALRFAFSISSLSVPNSELGVSVNKEDVDNAYRLVFTNICQQIDQDITVTEVKKNRDKITLKVSYPYGILEVDA